MFVPRNLLERVQSAKETEPGLWEYLGYTCYDETYPRPELTDEQHARLNDALGGKIGTLDFS